MKKKKSKTYNINNSICDSKNRIKKLYLKDDVKKCEHFKAYMTSEIINNNNKRLKNFILYIILVLN